AQRMAPARERRAMKRKLVTKPPFPTEVLEIRVLHPLLAQRLVGEVVHMLENEQPGHQPRRQRQLPGSHPTHRAEASRQKVPIDLPRQPHQRMAKVDDLLEKRAKQGVLAIVARLAHRSPPTANLAVEGITDHPNRESQTAKKPACTPGFLAKSITWSGQIIAIDQSLPNSSRTTIVATSAGGRGLEDFSDAISVADDPDTIYRTGSRTSGMQRHAVENISACTCRGQRMAAPSIDCIGCSNNWKKNLRIQRKRPSREMTRSSIIRRGNRIHHNPARKSNSS